MSPEDVFPRWMSKVLRGSLRAALFNQSTLSGNRVIHDRKPRQRLALDAPVVCKTCNNEWMGHIDKLTQPILAPLIINKWLPQDLSAEQCATLASWMTVKSMVLDRFAYDFHGQRSLFFTRAQASYIKNKKVPPSNISIWLGRMTRVGPATGNVRAIHYSNFRAHHLVNLTAFVCTLKVNEVWLQLIARRPQLYGSRLPSTIKFTTNPTIGAWSDYLTELWPNIPDTLAWPPRTMGDDSVFDRLAYRLTGVP